jgi:SET domain
MKVSSSSLLLLAVASTAAPRGALGAFWSSSSTSEKKKAEDAAAAADHAKALTEWFRKADATFLHPSLEIRPKSGDDPRLGVFTTAEISEGDMILSVPRSLVLTPTVPQVGDRVDAVEENSEEVVGTVTEIRQSDGTYTVEDEEGNLVHGIALEKVRHQDLGVSCGSVRRLIQEIKFGDSSLFAPYVKFARHAASAGTIPASWSAEGKALLQEILGKSEDGLELLPPLGSTDILEEHWVKACNGNGNDAEEVSAFYTTLRRLWGDQFVPVFDLLGHRNGPHTNAYHSQVQGEEPVAVHASRTLAAGEEVQISYNFCEECLSRRLDYGTPEIFRDYGFVERYPQRWVFYFKTHEPIVFDLDEDPEKNDELYIRWSAQFRFPTEEADAAFFHAQAARLEALGKSPALAKNANGVPDNEYSVLKQYHQALLTALKIGGDNMKAGAATGEFEVMDTEEELEEEEMARREGDGDEEEFEDEFFDEEEEEEL